MTKLISSQPNIRYFSGFTGSVGILIIQDRSSCLIVDGRYTQQAKAEVSRSTKVLQAPHGSTIWDLAIDLLASKKISTLGYDEEKFDVALFNKIRKRMPKLELHSISRQIRDRRAVKNEHEIELIAKAALIADLTFDCIVHIIRPGMTENEISAHIDYLIKTFKGEYPAFETLVSSGKLSAYPHGKPTDKQVKAGELIILDFGARYKGYNSDITRMVSIGEPSKKQLSIYYAVLKAQQAAISKIRDGVAADMIDSAARDVLDKEKLGKYFVHGTGHGVGLQVHEAPRVSNKSKDVLKEGMIVTVEPGVYLHGFCGFRLEDMVLVKKSGYELLTKSPRDLKVIA